MYEMYMNNMENQRLIGKPLTPRCIHSQYIGTWNWNVDFQGFVVLWFTTIADGIPELTSDMSDIFITSRLSINHDVY